MPQGDAVRQVPTVADEMAKFKGFSTHNGETVTDVADSDEEKNAQAASAAADETAAKAAKARPVKEFVGQKDGQISDKAAAKSAETAEDDDGETGQETGQEDDSKTLTMAEHKKLMARAASKRIGEVKKAGRVALAAEKQRGDALEGRIAALEGKGLTPAKAGATDNPDKEPDPKDFEFGEMDSKFIRALARYEARQEFKAAEGNQQKTKQQQDAEREAAEIVTQRTALEEAGAEAYDDFDDVVTQSRQLDQDDPAWWPLSRELGQLVLASDVGHHVAYHLASHPDEARKIFGKSPMEQAAYFGRLEAKFEATPGAKDPKQQPAGGQQQQVKAPKAPAPPRNGARGSGGTTPLSAATTDFAAFEAKARAEGARRR